LVEFVTPVPTSYGNGSQPGQTHHEDRPPLLGAQRMRRALLIRSDNEATLAGRGRV